jgi:serine phosphatase RsbU (regulator of sigma subunit)/anti-sigma regulatory factor (Ser/Thr protein kinase)
MSSARTFPASERSVPEARSFVRRELEAWGAPELVDSAALATSELVTNAVTHAGTAVRVGLLLDDFRLRVEVQDQHPGRTLPTASPPASDDAEHGRGLLITAALATTWGVDYTDATKRVWLEIERRPGATALPPGPPDDVEATSTVLIAVVELSGSGQVAEWNDDAVRLLGWRRDDVVGRPWESLLDGADPAPDAWTPRARWQGELTLRSDSGAATQAFVAQHPLAGRDRVVLLVVPSAQRALIEHRAAPVPARKPEAAPLGLREDALEHLGVDDFLDLAVERSREAVGADAGYLLLARDTGSDLEVAAVSGLDARLRGRRFDRATPGTLNQTNPHLPLRESHLDEGVVPPLLAGTGARSLLVVPVLVDGTVVGALGVASEHAGGFDDTQAVALHQLAGAVAAATDRARLRAAEVERRHWLNLLDQASVLLAGSLDQQMTMALTSQVVVPQLATWCAIQLSDERGRPVLEHVWHRDESALGPLRAALERADPDRPLEEAGDAVLRGPLHTVPLTARGREIGVLTLGRPGAEPLTGEVLRVAESLARRAALAIDNARAHGELQAVGEALQRSLLPPTLQVPEGLEVGVVYEAAGEVSMAGGDFYDLFPIGGGRWAWAVGDVCGTGAEAAAVTGLARHTIRALLLAGFPVAATLERLNSAILDEGERSRFLTLVCGVLDPVRSGRAPLSMVIAGHPPPFLLRRGEVRQVGHPQELLGVQERVAYAEDHLELERGDLLVTVTDGVLERREGTRMLGEDGLEPELVAAAGLAPQAVADRVRRLVLDFAPEPQADDMAILAIRVPGHG